MIPEIALKLAEVLGVVTLHHAAEHVVTERDALKRALSSYVVFRSRHIRVSIAQMLSLKIDEKYLLIQSARRPQLTPIGGVVRYFPSEASNLEGKVRFNPEFKKGPERYDLRGFVKGRDFVRFLRWYASAAGREQLALAREIEEEFIEVGISTIRDHVRRPEFIMDRAVHEGPDELLSEAYWQYRYFEVLRLREESDVSKELSDFIKAQSKKNPKLVLVSTGEIKKGRTDDGKHHIGDSCGYLFSGQRQGIKPPPLF
jgi:hypothetical protein